MGKAYYSNSKSCYVLNFKIYPLSRRYTKSEKKPLEAEGAVFFSSLREAQRAIELQLLQKSGEISELQFQYPMPFKMATGLSKRKYVADFKYKKSGATTYTIEDVKGKRKGSKKPFTTAMFNLKWHLTQLGYPDFEYYLNFD